MEFDINTGFSRYSSPVVWPPSILTLFGPKLIWGAIGAHCFRRKIEISWDLRKSVIKQG